MQDAPHRTRLAWAVRTTSHEVRDPSSIYFAPSRAKARALCISEIQDAWSCTWLEAAKNIISIRRAPDRDVTLPPRHALLPLAIGAWAVLALVAVLLIHIVARMLP